MPTKYKFPAQAPQDAIEWFGSKKLKPQFDYRDVYREEHAYAFVVAKVMQMDVLQSIYDELNKALKDGQTFQQFKNNLIPTLQKQGWWGEKEELDPYTQKRRVVRLGNPRRLKTIYRVNTRTARAAGQWQRIERTRKSHPYLVYELGASREHREQHVRWAGILLPSNDPFWQTHYPPNGWGCKCRVRQVSQREYERLKATGRYLTEAPAINRKEWINKRSGEVHQVPEGIDPSFDTNVGTARQQHIQNLITTKLNSSHSAIATVAAKELVHSPAFTYFLSKPVGNYPVASIDAALKQQINAKQNTVLISAETMTKQRRNHPELTDDEYRLLPDVINTGAVIQQGAQHIVIFNDNDRRYRAEVRTTSSGDENHVVSFHRTSK